MMNLHLSSSLLGKRVGIMAVLAKDILVPCVTLSCRFEPTFASKFLVPNFSYWHRRARNSMHVLIRTFSYPSVALHRD